MPSLLTISAVLLTVQALVVFDARELRLFRPQFPLADLCMRVMFAQLASRPEEFAARPAAPLAGAPPCRWCCPPSWLSARVQAGWLGSALRP